jgi:hypothetical protein
LPLKMSIKFKEIAWHYTGGFRTILKPTGCPKEDKLGESGKPH